MQNLRPRWHEATKELVQKLEANGVNFETLNALEMFGRKGDWHTTIYSNKTKSLEIWEVEPSYESDLKKNFPNAKIRILDSIEMLDKENLPKFDLVVIDNPMNTFGLTVQDGKIAKYCEHFDALKKIDKIIGKEALIVFNVNRHPFDYSNNLAWKKRREEFYGPIDTSNMNLDFLFDFYKKFFNRLCFETIFNFNVVRVYLDEIDMTHYFVYKLKRF